MTQVAISSGDHWLQYEPSPVAARVPPHPAFPHTPPPSVWMPKVLYHLSVTGKMKEACDAAGISTAIPRYWATRDITFGEALRAAMDDAVWSVEDKLIDDMNDRRNPLRTTAKIFYLKGRRRGVFGDNPPPGTENEGDTPIDQVVSSMAKKLENVKKVTTFKPPTDD